MEFSWIVTKFAFIAVFLLSPSHAKTATFASSIRGRDEKEGHSNGIALKNQR